MNWQFIIGNELLWLGAGFVALAFGVGIYEFFSNLFGDEDE